MMSELKRIIAQGEGETLDFKFRVDDQKKIARTLSAFANTSGGSLLIGVKDNGKIAGCDPEEEFYMIDGAANLYCNPPVKFESKVWKEDHHLVLEVIVAASDDKHKSKDENGQWKFYHRLNDKTLLGNKITFLLWRFVRDGKPQPETFDNEVLTFIRLVNELEPVTVSKLFRKSNLAKNRVNELLATLVYWEILEREVTDSGIKYFVAD